jgi:hypothetical protein
MGERITDHFSNAFGRIAGFLPELISAAIILLIGYLLAKLAGSLVRNVLSRTRFDTFVHKRLERRRALTREPERVAVEPRRPPSTIVGSLTFWIGMLITLSMAARTLRLESLAVGLNRILAFIPNVLVAAVIVGVAAVLADLLAEVIGDVARGWLARSARVAVMVLAVFMALDQLGIATRVVTITFTVLLSAAAVAAAIAFGIGGIPLARDYTRRWAARAEEERRPIPIEPELPPEPVTH